MKSLEAKQIKEIPLSIRLGAVRKGVTFYNCLTACSKEEELIEQFDRLNHSNLLRRGSALELMIDTETGRTTKELQAFIDFCWECVFLRF